MAKPVILLSVSLALIMILAGCTPDWRKEGWTSKGSRGEWTLEVPAGLVAEKNLNQDAILELHSPNSDFFLVLRRDSLLTLQSAQPDFVLEDFLDLSIERIIASLSDPEVPEAQPATINGAGAHRAKITGRFKNDHIRYELALVEGSVYMYQVLIWIPEKVTEAYQPVMDQVIQSLKVSK